MDKAANTKPACGSPAPERLQEIADCANSPEQAGWLQTMLVEYQQHNMSEASPQRQMLLRIGERWSALLIVMLLAGPMRHAQLLRATAFISMQTGGAAPAQRVITRALRKLERDGLVSRTVAPTVPPRVDYELTEPGRELGGILEQLRTWANMRAPLVLEARESFDRSSASREAGE